MPLIVPSDVTALIRQLFADLVRTSNSKPAFSSRHRAQFDLILNIGRNFSSTGVHRPGGRESLKTRIRPLAGSQMYT